MKNTDVIKRLNDLKRFGIVEEDKLIPDLDSNMVITGTKTRKVRTLGDLGLISKSQNIYKTGADVTLPPPKSGGGGVTEGADMTGSWGKPK